MPQPRQQALAGGSADSIALQLSTADSLPDVAAPSLQARVDSTSPVGHSAKPAKALAINARKTNSTSNGESPSTSQNSSVEKPGEAKDEPLPVMQKDRFNVRAKVDPINKK
jgi:hypothetical protein